MADDANQAPEFVLDWAKLTAPVPAADIEWVEKAAGMKFAYMSAQFVRRRLDSVAEGRWSYSCEVVPFVQGQPPSGDGEPFVVEGTISLDGTGMWLSRSSLGSGKNFKEAETDAFKRAAQRLGIGNELYEMDPQRPGRAQAAAPQRPLKKPDAVADEAAATCPECAGPMWDNRLNKTNPRAPDYKCKDRSCTGVLWPPKPGQAAPKQVEDIKGMIDADDDELGF